MESQQTSIEVTWTFIPEIFLMLQGTHGTGKTGKMAKKYPCQGKHREFGNFVKTQGKNREFGLNTGNFVSSSCKCSDSKSKAYCYSCHKKILFFFQKLDRSAKSVLCM